MIFHDFYYFYIYLFAVLYFSRFLMIFHDF